MCHGVRFSGLAALGAAERLARALRSRVSQQSQGFAGGSAVGELFETGGGNPPVLRESRALNPASRVLLLVDVEFQFSVAEQVLDPDGNRIAQFLTLSMKAHDVAFIQHEEKAKFHHASFYLETWEDILRAADLISMTNTSLDIGPTRHGITHGKTIYFFDPSGNRNEVFAGGDYMYPDHNPITWKAEDLGKAIFYHDRVLNERFLTVLT